MPKKPRYILEDKCTGCGECVPNCAEGAIQIIDGKEETRTIFANNPWSRLADDSVWLFVDDLGEVVALIQSSLQDLQVP